MAQGSGGGAGDSGLSRVPRSILELQHFDPEMAGLTAMLGWQRNVPMRARAARPLWSVPATRPSQGLRAAASELSFFAKLMQSDTVV